MWKRVLLRLRFSLTITGAHNISHVDVRGISRPIVRLPVYLAFLEAVLMLIIHQTKQEGSVVVRRIGFRCFVKKTVTISTRWNSFVWRRGLSSVCDDSARRTCGRRGWRILSCPVMLNVSIHLCALLGLRIRPLVMMTVRIRRGKSRVDLPVRCTCSNPKLLHDSRKTFTIFS